MNNNNDDGDVPIEGGSDSSDRSDSSYSSLDSVRPYSPPCHYDDDIVGEDDDHKDNDDGEDDFTLPVDPWWPQKYDFDEMLLAPPSPPAPPAPPRQLKFRPTLPTKMTKRRIGDRGAEVTAVVPPPREEAPSDVDFLPDFLPKSDDMPMDDTFAGYTPTVVGDSARLTKRPRITCGGAVCGGESEKVGANEADEQKEGCCLDPEKFKQFKLVERTQLSHNVAKFRFSLPTPTSVLGLPIGQHMSCRGKDGQGEEVIKPYTPTTLDSDVGYFELVIKMYPQGRMSHHFREMRVGDYMAVKGPKGRFKYQPGHVSAFGMIAGGSGITPMFQVARAILENPQDKTMFHLIYANVTSEDILLKEELDALATNYPDRFKIYYVLNQPPEAWNGGVGFVSKEMIQTHFPAPAPDVKILRCGPPPMNKAMAAHLDNIGYSSEMQFQF